MRPDGDDEVADLPHFGHQRARKEDMGLVCIGATSRTGFRTLKASVSEPHCNYYTLTIIMQTTDCANIKKKLINYYYAFNYINLAIL